MTEYIDRDALLKKIEECRPEWGYCDDNTAVETQRQFDWDWFEELVRAIPSLDAVPVIRCKDCKCAEFSVDPICRATTRRGARCLTIIASKRLTFAAMENGRMTKMADCTKVVDFFRTLQRLAASDDGISCDDCGICPAHKPGRYWAPSWELVPPCRGDGEALLRVAQLIPELQQWADDHPLETWLSRAQKLLPEMDADRIVENICPMDLFGDAAEPADFQGSCPVESWRDCGVCWRREAT